jgi:flagellar basal-body rod modification protein FlgD
MIGSDFDIGGLALPRPTASRNSKELGQAEFLELMIAQIQNQDPFEPVENSAFVGQLAQFSTVTGISEISQSVGALSDALLANQAIQASTMIGRSVLVESSRGALNAGGTMRGSVDMPIDAAAATVRISDQAGQLVREFEVKGPPGSLVDYTWNGVNRDGEPVAPGIYEIEAFVDGGLSDLSISTLAHVKVLSVSLDPSGAGSLITTEDGQQLRLAQVRAIQ